MFDLHEAGAKTVVAGKSAQSAESGDDEGVAFSTGGEGFAQSGPMSWPRPAVREWCAVVLQGVGSTAVDPYDRQPRREGPAQ